MTTRLRHSAVVYTLTWLTIFPFVAVSFVAAGDIRVDPQGIEGKLVLAGGGELPEAIIARFVELAGGSSGKLVLIPTAAADRALSNEAKLLEPWQKFELASTTVLHTRDRAEANRPEFIERLQTATAVWIGGGQQSRLADSYLGTVVEHELTKLLQRGGVIGGNSAGAAIMSRIMIAGGNPHPRIATGFNLLPDAVVDQHFRNRDRKPRLLEGLATHPGKFGLGIDESTAVVVDGRQMHVIGRGKSTICLSASAGRPAVEYELSDGDRSDLVMLRRAAKIRASEVGLRLPTGPPAVEHGALILGGGGRMPATVISRFIDLAGGPDQLIVVLPTASEIVESSGAGDRRMFERAGGRNIVVLKENAPDEVESPEFLDTLAKAGGVWFGGGRQWRFVDAYAGTKAVEAFRDVLRRGGVIGGSSAGASIQAEYLVRGSPLRNTDMMVEGYEHGFAFLPGTAVDQHFTQRSRRKDMDSLTSAHPKFLGIGIDESTALVVRANVAEVHGEHSVWFFDRTSDPKAEPIQVHNGESFDLLKRTRTGLVGNDHDHDNHSSTSPSN